MDPTPEHGRLDFGPFTLDFDDESLRRGGRRLALRRKSFAVLCHLALRRDRLTTKEELLRVVWQGSAVSESVLKVCVSELRRALGERRGAPRYIETVHGRGYRFIG
jgi:DNA-binding winged helix-turn-helix (wHTH) protein